MTWPPEVGILRGTFSIALIMFGSLSSPSSLSSATACFLKSARFFNFPESLAGTGPKTFKSLSHSRRSVVAVKLVEELFAQGHPNILGTHRMTFEITKEHELSRRGDCIIAVNDDQGAGGNVGRIQKGLHARIVEDNDET